MSSSSSSAASNTKFFDMDQKEAEPGDLIQISRGDDNYWGVYVGGGYVVHLVKAERGSSSSGGVVGVVLNRKLQDVDRWRVNNLLDDKHTPRPADDIVKEACSLEQQQYDLLTYNSQHFATEMRYGGLSSSSAASNRKFMDGKEVKPGDLIEILRNGGNNYLAVYVGDGKIVHFAVPDRCPSSTGLAVNLCGVAKVLKQKLEDVVKKNRWIVNNLLDDKYKPRPADEIVRDACSPVDTELEYNLLKYNSEHFATEMRYGKYENEWMVAALKPVVIEGKDMIIEWEERIL